MVRLAGQLKIEVADFTRVVRRQVYHHPVIDTKPFRVVIHLFRY